MVKTIWNVSKKHKEKQIIEKNIVVLQQRSAKVPIIPGDRLPWGSLGMEEVKSGGKLNIQIGSRFYVLEKETEAKRYGKFAFFSCLNETSVISKSLFCC